MVRKKKKEKKVGSVMYGNNCELNCWWLYPLAKMRLQAVFVLEISWLEFVPQVITCYWNFKCLFCNRRTRYRICFV